MPAGPGAGFGLRRQAEAATKLASERKVTRPTCLIGHPSHSVGIASCFGKPLVFALTKAINATAKVISALTTSISAVAKVVSAEAKSIYAVANSISASAKVDSALTKSIVAEAKTFSTQTNIIAASTQVVFADAKRILATLKSLSLMSSCTRLLGATAAGRTRAAQVCGVCLY